MSEKMNYFSFYESFDHEIDELPEDLQAKFCRAIIKYGLYGTELEFENPLERALFKHYKNAIDNQRARSQVNSGNRKKTKSNEKKEIETKSNEKKEIKTNCNETERNADEEEYEYELEKEIDTDTEKENACMCENPTENYSQTLEENHFLELWRHIKRKSGMTLFQPLATIKKPNDWRIFWQTSPPTIEQIDRAMTNFLEAIDNGWTESRYIPSSPDGFVLNGNIHRYQTSARPISQKEKEARAILDERESLI